MTRDLHPDAATSVVPSDLRSALLVGDLHHRRLRPTEHAFRYEVWHALLDVDELPVLDERLRGFGWNRPAPVGFRDTDHLGDVDLPVRTKLERWLSGQGVALPDGPVLLWTSLRMFGYVFDPVSWWFCHDRAGDLALVVAEVNNTFGDTHGYVLDDLEEQGHDVVARATKVFHVSPFMPVEPLQYGFRFRPPSLDGPAPGAPAERVAVRMDVADDVGHLFDATLGERREPLTTSALWAAVRATPWVTAKTTAAIHWQALHLARKRVGFHRRPEPPDTGLDAVARPASRPGPGTERSIEHW